MKGTRFLDGHSQVDEHRGRLGLKGWSDNESGASGQAVSDVFSSFQ